MRFISHITAAWINRQYRMTYRDESIGVLASGQFNIRTEKQLISDASHELTVLALKKYQENEVKPG